MSRKTKTTQTLLQTLKGDWPINRRAIQCCLTEKAFAEEDVFYTLLFERAEGFERRDLSQEGWQKFQADPSFEAPFSFWRSRFKKVIADDQPLSDQDRFETLFRELAGQLDPGAQRACYVVALMLERKKRLRQVDIKEREDGQVILIYENPSTNEVFMVPDPDLKLNELEPIQREVAELLATLE
ncbi:MAG: hypothetical protein ACFCU3_10825 [Verrucomicrobiales bacterium]